MKAILVTTNGDEFDCEISRSSDIVHFAILTDYETIYSTFSDGSLKTLKYENKEVDITRYRILVEISDNRNGIFIVKYRELTAFEKLIELHYGGVN